jgi:phage tail tube protein FII
MGNFLREVLLPLLTGKKTVTKFDAWGMNVNVSITPGLYDPRKFDKDLMDAALKAAVTKAVGDAFVDWERKRRETPDSGH